MADVLEPFAGKRAKKLAARLIERFGSLHRALAIDPATISDADSAEACRIAQSSAQLVATALQEELKGATIRADDPKLLGYLRLKIGTSDDECIHAIFLDFAGRYLRDETIAAGGLDQIGVRGRQLFARALTLGAQRIIIAHNHPSGDCKPSQIDLDTTLRLRGAAQTLGILLADHLIVTKTACFSMKAGKML